MAHDATSNPAFDPRIGLLLPRIARRIVLDEHGCWIWTAADNGVGYGVAYFEERMQCTHRITYKVIVGPIPEGLKLDHLCRVPACCNPDHLEPVTHRENVRRGNAGGHYWAALTHCKRGHPFDEQNTARRSGRRHCRACARITQRARRAR